MTDTVYGQKRGLAVHRMRVEEELDVDRLG